MQAPLQRGPIVESTMPVSSSSPLPNGLQVHRAPIAGTRATTILVAFDAGARTERPEENGMAHFLEHLVFKGGEIYDDYRKVNETAERMGGSLNAYTSHDLVAFHITVRAEAAMVAEEVIDAASFGDHPLGRTVLGPEDHLRTFTRDGIVAFRSRRWSGRRGGAFVVGNLEHVQENGAVGELFARFPQLPAPEPFEPAPPLQTGRLV